MSDQPNEERFDLIVVGLGAMGAATLFHASRLGLRVLGIDRHDPPHEFGSSHAETRMTRLAVGEGPQYLPFVARSHEIWRALEVETGEQLLHQGGSCIITTRTVPDEVRWNDFVTATAEVARTGGIEFQLMEPEQFRRRHPSVNVGDEYRVGLEPTGGVIMAERVVAVQLRLAGDGGAEIRANEPVVAVTPDVSGVTVTTEQGTYRADRVAMATGAWLPGMTDPVDRSQLTVTRQVVYWFEVEDPSQFSTDDFPCIIWAGETIEDYFGVFPIPPGGTPGMKVLGEQFATTTDAQSVDREVSPQEIDDFYHRMVAPRLNGVTPNCIRAAVCLYTNTPDDHFLIDSAFGSDRVIALSPCSGHGFKHSTALGEAVAQVAANGDSTLDLSPFTRRW